MGWPPEVWIVGGGPSGLAFDLGRLEGKQVLSVNSSLFKLRLSLAARRYVRPLDSPAPAVFSLDHVWARGHRGFLADYPGERYLAVPLETWPDVGGIPGVAYLRRSPALGLSEDPGVIHAGCNSGYGALNLAVLMGAKDVHLVGFDMDPSQNENFVHWAPLFRTMLPQLGRLGVTVTNHNRYSFVDAFAREG